MGICWWPGAGKDDFSIMPFELSVQLSHVFKWEETMLRGLGGTTGLVLELQLTACKAYCLPHWTHAFFLASLFLLGGQQFNARMQR